jgi:hypothetical protein
VIPFPKDPVRLITVSAPDAEDATVSPLEVLDNVKETNPEWVCVVSLNKDGDMSIFSSHDDIIECYYYLIKASKFFMSDSSDLDD